MIISDFDGEYVKFYNKPHIKIHLEKRKCFETPHQEIYLTPWSSCCEKKDFNNKPKKWPRWRLIILDFWNSYISWIFPLSALNRE